MVNYVNAQTACHKCEDDNTPISTAKCFNCGDKCIECQQSNNLLSGCDRCGFREKIVSGDNTIEDFCLWLFTKQHYHFKVFSHNGKSFDNHFILRHMLSQGASPKVIYQGSKIITMSFKNIRFIDSACFCLMALSQLPKAFGLEEDLSKQAFPHFFNTSENQHYHGVRPAPHFYGVEDMTEIKKEAFLKWYENTKDEVFDFKAEMECYCRMDTSILRKAMLKFRQILVKLCQIDPFESVTIAGLCMRIFRQNFMTENWIATLNGEKVPVFKLKG